jgi:hypothetical protein
VKWKIQPCTSLGWSLNFFTKQKEKKCSESNNVDTSLRWDICGNGNRLPRFYRQLCFVIVFLLGYILRRRSHVTTGVGPQYKRGSSEFIDR